MSSGCPMGAGKQDGDMYSTGQAARAGRGGSSRLPVSQQHLCLYLERGLALNLEIKQPAIPVCTGISDTVRNLICVTAETQLEAEPTKAWALQVMGS